MIIQIMTVFRTVVANGVVVPNLMNAVYVMVMVHHVLGLLIWKFKMLILLQVHLIFIWKMIHQLLVLNSILREFLLLEW